MNEYFDGTWMDENDDMYLVPIPQGEPAGFDWMAQPWFISHSACDLKNCCARCLIEDVQGD